ncbi:MAG: nitroreductase family protein [Alphaproteobacteria bacterium]|nr:nitroreductase family protein [Alphaproteobacteria bacterium]
MELYEGLLSRRSIRKYNPEKTLTKDEIYELIRAASYAPSAHNKQPWHFLVIENKETLKSLRALQPWTSFAKDAACAIIVCADMEETFNRPKEGWNYAQIDGALAAQNLLLACHAKGLGACFCGAAPMPMVVSGLREKFNMPETMLPVAIVTIGYPEETPKVPEDRLKKDKVYFETF